MALIDEIDLGKIGEMTTIGLIEALQNIPKYTTTSQVVS